MFQLVTLFVFLLFVACIFGIYVYKKMEKKRNQVRAVLIGFDFSGKTSILQMLKISRIETCIPHIGFNVETVSNIEVTFASWDLSRRNEPACSCWFPYLKDIHTIVFVIDSTDRSLCGQIKKQLKWFLDQRELTNAALLILANKQDIFGAMTSNEIIEALELFYIQNRKWNIIYTSAVTGYGLDDALACIYNNANKAQV